MLMTRAGVGLISAPGTGRPAAQLAPSSKSDVLAPQRPDTRTGWISDVQLIPASPSALCPAAPMIPAMKVPCQLLSDASSSGGSHKPAGRESPGSLASESRPLPSFAPVL